MPVTPDSCRGVLLLLGSKVEMALMFFVYVVDLWGWGLDEWG